MQITEVRVFPVDEDKLKAFASIVIDDAFVVSDIKIIQGRNGRFLSMPSTRRRNGTFRDIAHPLNQDTRRLIEEKVFGKYDEALAAERRSLVKDSLVVPRPSEELGPPPMPAPSLSADGLAG